MAPIVSQACIFRTKLLVESIRRIFNARLSVTLIGNPSGTATTISVTAIIKYFSVRSKTGSHSCHPFSEPKSKNNNTSLDKEYEKSKTGNGKADLSDQVCKFGQLYVQRGGLEVVLCALPGYFPRFQ